MPDRELELINNSIRECQIGKIVYLGFASALILAGIYSYIWLSPPATGEAPYHKAMSAIIALFGALPVRPFFSARSRQNFLHFLKDSRQDARKIGNSSELEELNKRITDFFTKELNKPFWSSK